MHRSIRVILDTNWWIGFIVSKSSTGFPSFLLMEGIIICFSKELQKEIGDTLSYARTIKRINENNLKTYQLLLNDAVTFVQSHSVVSICRDPKDNFLLSLAKDAQADFLITNDEDLLVLDPFESTRILKLSDFINLLSGMPDL